jgi:hypothetical protein
LNYYLLNSKITKKWFERGHGTKQENMYGTCLERRGKEERERERKRE